MNRCRTRRADDRGRSDVTIVHVKRDEIVGLCSRLGSAGRLEARFADQPQNVRPLSCSFDGLDRWQGGIGIRV